MALDRRDRRAYLLHCAGGRKTRCCRDFQEDMMTTAKEIMHTGATCIGEHETLAAAAQYMRDLDVGALPICGDDGRLHGMITDRDIVTKCIAAGHDPNDTTAGELAQGDMQSFSS
jgi:CBS domain-containing protein